MSYDPVESYRQKRRDKKNNRRYFHVTAILVLTIAVVAIIMGEERHKRLLNERNRAAQTYSQPAGGTAGQTSLQRSTNAVRQRTVATVVNMAEYSAIKNGMSYSDTVKIIGHEGTEMANSYVEGVPGVMASITMRIVSWQNNDGSNMNVTLQNDKVVGKAQLNLP